MLSIDNVVSNCSHWLWPGSISHTGWDLYDTLDITSQQNLHRSGVEWPLWQSLFQLLGLGPGPRRKTPLPGLFYLWGGSMTAPASPHQPPHSIRKPMAPTLGQRTVCKKSKVGKKKKKICWGNSSVTSHPLFYLTAKTTLSQVQSLFHHDHICTAKSFLIWLCSTDLSLLNIGIG